METTTLSGINLHFTFRIFLLGRTGLTLPSMKRWHLLAIMAMASTAVATPLEVPFHLDAKRMVILIEAKIDAKPVLLLLDTGSTFTVIDRGFADVRAFDLKRARFENGGPGLKFEAVWRQVDLTLGSRLWRARRVAVTDLSEFSKITIDYTRSVITFGQPGKK
jgi:hypothetical protein